MKYGRTERISGIVILLALVAILVPWLMSDPAPREDEPQPSFSIEQPVDVPHNEVPAPQKPDTISQGKPLDDESEIIDTPPLESAMESSTMTDDEASEPSTAEVPKEGERDSQPKAASSKKSDPIAEMMAQGDSAPQAVQNGEWAVQVGSFGQADNAKRLKKELENQGFRVYTQARDNQLTTVLVGPFASSEDGESARALIKKRANQQGLLVRVED